MLDSDPAVLRGLINQFNELTWSLVSHMNFT